MGLLEDAADDDGDSDEDCVRYDSDLYEHSSDEDDFF